MTTALKAAISLVVADIREQYDEDFPDEIAVQLCLDSFTLHDYVVELGPDKWVLEAAYRLVFDASPAEIYAALED